MSRTSVVSPTFDHDFEGTTHAAMAEFGPSEFDVSAAQRALEKFLCEVERLTGGTVDAEGEPLMMSDDALNAFEEGVTASDYALQVQATRAAV